MSRRFENARLLACCVCLLGCLAAIPLAQSGWTPADAAWLDAEADSFRVEHEIPGLSVAIGIRGELIYARGFGAASLDDEPRVTAETRFRAASITKPVTAVAVLRLADAGRLDLDAPARQYCPEFPEKAVNPTVRHLLAHRSGIPHPTDDEDTTITGEYTWIRDAMPLVAGEPLQFTPGTDAHYSSWGYVVLGCVLEGVMERPYWEIVRELVFAPAGLSSPARDTPTFAAPDFSPGFRPGARGGMRPALIVDTRFKTPASGLIVSAPDLVRFGMAASGEALLSPGMRAAMFAPPEPDAPAGSFALGWQVSGPRPEGQRPVYHSGSMEGTTAFLFLGLDREFAVAILANRERFVPKTLELFEAISSRLISSAQ